LPEVFIFAYTNLKTHIMKKIYTIISLLLIVFSAAASQITIAVSNSQFTPSVVTAACGDTIIWAWASGNHTTTSTSVPGCATSWNANINSTNLTYSITIPCAGTYSYECTPHGFTGTITVPPCTNGIASIDNSFSSSVSPNPFSSKFTIEFSNADMISLYNVVGEKIKSIALQHGQTKAEINTTDLKEGIYFYCILREGIIMETRKVVKN